MLTFSPPFSFSSSLPLSLSSLSSFLSPLPYFLPLSSRVFINLLSFYRELGSTLRILTKLFPYLFLLQCDAMICMLFFFLFRRIGGFIFFFFSRFSIEYRRSEEVEIVLCNVCRFGATIEHRRRIIGFSFLSLFNFPRLSVCSMNIWCSLRFCFLWVIRVLYIDSRWRGVCIEGCVFNGDPRASLTLQHPPSCVRSMFDFTLNLFNIWDSVTWMWIGSWPMNLFDVHSVMCLLNKRLTRSLMHPWFMSDLLNRLVSNLFDQFLPSLLSHFSLSSLFFFLFLSFHF